MKVTLSERPKKTIEDLSDVKMELTATEFILLATLAYKSLTGIHPARDSLEKGLKTGFKGLTGRDWAALQDYNGDISSVLYYVEDKVL